MPDEDKCAIVNSKIEWKATNFTWLVEKTRKAQAKEKHRPRPHNEDEEDDENFIIHTVDDRVNMLRYAFLENDDYVRFEETNNSDDDVQIRLRPDRTMIEIQYLQYS